MSKNTGVRMTEGPLYLYDHFVLIGIMDAVNAHYKTIRDSHYWLSRDTAHIYSTAEDIGWGCGYRNAQMIFSCLLDDPVYADHIKSGRTYCS